MFFKSKKSQLKIQQTAFMLVGLTILFAFVGLFFIAMLFSNMGESAEESAQREAMLLVSRLANSPEFSCGTSFGTTKTNCVDFDKVMALKSRQNNYRDFWGNIEAIEIRKIYPSGDRVCTRENYPNCEILKVNTDDISGEYIGTFVSLCRKENYNGRISENCEIAKLMVSYTSR